MGSAQILKYKSLKVIIALFIFFGTISVNVNAADVSTVSISPSSQTISPEESFTVDVSCVPGQPIKAFEFKLSFDPSLIQVNSVVEGDFFAEYNTFFNAGIVDNTAGTIINIYNLIIGAGNVSDPGTFVSINLTAKNSAGDSSLDLYEVGVTDEDGYLSISVNDGSVTILGTEGDDPPDDGGSSGGGSSGGGGSGGSSTSGGGNYDGNSSDDQNTPPEIPMIPSGPTFVEMGVEYSYSGSTFDVDGDQIRLRFDWGDGSYSDWSEYVSSNSTIEMSHSWDFISIFEVKIMAQDENNSNISWSSSLQVIVSQDSSGEVPIIIDIEYSINESEDLKIEFDASGSFDIDGNITSYYWDFGDGQNETGINPVHVYMNPGTYMVTLVVTDDDNGTYSKSIYVTVGSDVESLTDDESEEKGIPLLFIIIGIIGIVSVIILCLLGFFKHFDKSFSSKSDFSALEHKKLFNNKEKIERLDAKIGKLKKAREMTDIKGASETLENYSSESLNKYEMAIKYIDSKIVSTVDEEKSDEELMREKIDRHLKED